MIMVLSIVFASQAFAVLRPLFPAKAAPPFGTEAIVIGKGSIQHSAKQAPATAPKNKGWISRETQALACVTGAFSPLWLSTHAERDVIPIERIADLSPPFGETDGRSHPKDVRARLQGTYVEVLSSNTASNLICTGG